MTQDFSATDPGNSRPAEQSHGSGVWTQEGPVRPVLSRAVHDRDGLRRRHLHASFQDDPDSRVLVVTEDYLVPITETDTGPALAWRQIAASGSDPGACSYLGTHEGITYLFARGGRDLQADRWVSVREVGAEVDDLAAGLLVQAIGLAQWHDRSRHCPLCGAMTELRDSGWVRTCPVDGSDIFPRTDPAMIVLVHDGADRCVLGRQSVWPSNRFSVLAGFVEPGESAEQAVVREVFEEVRISVREVTYVTSQPWPLPQSLMLGFTAEADPDQQLVVDEHELAEAGWFSRAELLDPDRLRPKLPPPVSIAHQLISNWLGARPPAARDR